MQSQISPLSISKRNVLASLSSKKMRSKHNLFIVEGKKSVRDLVDYCGDKFSILYFVAVDKEVQDAISIASSYRSRSNASDHKDGSQGCTEVYSASEDDMRKISSLTSLPGVIAVCRLPEAPDEQSLYESKLPEDLYLMLDGVQDPGNLGTIIRTAHWFGIKKIFASKDSVDLYNPKVVQASMGSLGSVAIEYVDLPRLADANPSLPMIGLLLEGLNLFQSPRLKAGFLVMGNEGNGITPKMREKIDHPLTIPPYYKDDHSESLNVAIATAITLAHFRQ